MILTVIYRYSSQKCYGKEKLLIQVKPGSVLGLSAYTGASPGRHGLGLVYPRNDAALQFLLLRKK